MMRSMLSSLWTELAGGQSTSATTPRNKASAERVHRRDPAHFCADFASSAAAAAAFRAPGARAALARPLPPPP